MAFFSADMEESDVRDMIQERMIDEGDTGKGVLTRNPHAILQRILLNIQGVVATTAFIQRLVNAVGITRLVVIMVIQGNLTIRL